MQTASGDVTTCAPKGPGVTADIEDQEPRELMTNPDQLRCDNFAICGSSVPVQATEVQTLMLARARGWHLWAGVTYANEFKRVTLCKQCVGQHARYRQPPPIDPLGQDPLFS